MKLTTKKTFTATLELSEREAAILHAICGCVAGTANKGARALTDRIYEQLGQELSSEAMSAVSTEGVLTVDMETDA